MAVISVPVTAWAPDIPPLGSSAFTTIHNATTGVGPSQGTISLNSLKSASLFSNTSMDSRPLGSAIGQNKDGVAKVYGGCAEKLYKLSPVDRQWQNISRSGGYTTSPSERWKSIEFGTLQIFTNFSNEIQYIDMNADVGFQDLTSIVKARHIATTKGFVIVANTTDALDGGKTNRVRWSGIESPSDFSPSPATMSDWQDIAGGGAIMGLVTDEQCWVLLQKSIVSMTFVGAPYAFSFQDIIVGKGCSVSESVVTVAGGRHIFLSDDGWYMLQAGQLTPIGGAINKWFLETADLSQSHLMTTSVDPRETLVYFSFVSKNSQTAVPDTLLIYNYETGTWTTASATTAFIWNALSLPTTIDALDAYGTLDMVPASFDDPIWAGGKALLFGMSATGAVYSFSGNTLPLSIETPEYQLSRLVGSETQADIARVDALRPLFEGSGTAVVQTGCRSLTNTDIVWSDLRQTHPETGFSYMRSQSRYQRFRVSIEGDWSRMTGLEIDAKAVGRR